MKPTEGGRPLADMLGNLLFVGDKVATDITSYKRSRTQVATITKVVYHELYDRWALSLTYERDGLAQGVGRYSEQVVAVKEPE